MKAILWSLIGPIVLVGYTNCSKSGSTNTVVEPCYRTLDDNCVEIFEDPDTTQEYLIVREYNLKVSGYKINLSQAETAQPNRALERQWQITVPNNSTIHSTRDLNSDRIEDFYVKDSNTYTFYSGATGQALGLTRTLATGTTIIGDYDLTTPEPEYVEVTVTEILIKKLSDGSVLHRISFSPNSDFFSPNIWPRFEFIGDTDGDQKSEIYIKTEQPMGATVGSRNTERLLNGRTSQLSQAFFMDRYTSFYSTQATSSLVWNPMLRKFIYIKDGNQIQTLSTSGVVETIQSLSEKVRATQVSQSTLFGYKTASAKNLFLDKQRLALIGTGRSLVVQSNQVANSFPLNLSSDWSYAASYVTYQNEVFRQGGKAYILSYIRLGETERIQIVNEDQDILDIENSVNGSNMSGRAMYFVVLNRESI